jgi:hypothetical protein
MLIIFYIVLLLLLANHIMATSLVLQVLRDLKDEEERWMHDNVHRNQYGDKTEPNSPDSSVNTFKM